MSLIASLVLLTLAVLSPPASAWNIPGHMLSAAIAYQVLQQEHPQTIEKIKAVLEKHPWYADRWHTRLQDVPVAERDQVLFMQAARWPDDSCESGEVMNGKAKKSESDCQHKDTTEKHRLKGGGFLSV